VIAGRAQGTVAGAYWRLDRLSVLVVDDDPEITALLCDLFAALGFARTVAAPNGEVARTMLADRKAQPIDLVVADVAVAPDRRATLTDWIRRHPRSPNRYLPVIVLADATDLEAALAVRARGATEVLVKPVTVDSLCAVLEAIIEAPRQFVDTRSYFGPDRRRHEMPYRGGERRDEAGAP